MIYTEILFKDHGGEDLCDQDLYFFTEQKLIPGKKQIDRRIGKGKWKILEQSNVWNKIKIIIGFKLVFRYQTMSSKSHHACWYMDEYSMEQTNPIISSGYVICRLYKKTENGDNTYFPVIQVPAPIEYAGPIPVGFRFHPSDEELIRYFLRNKITAEETKAVVAHEDLDLELSLKTITTRETIKPAQDKRKSNGLSNVETEAVVPVMLEEQMRKKEKGKEKVVEEGMTQMPSLQLMKYMKDKKKNDGARPLLPTEVNATGKGNPFLLECDLYVMRPWEIWGMFSEDELCYQDLFFFTRWKKANPNSQHLLRKVGSDGKWDELGPKRTVEDRSGKFIGSKQTFVYQKSDRPLKTEWFLDEYSLPEADIEEYVVCRLRKIVKSAAAVPAFDEDTSNKKMKVDACTFTPATTEGSNQGQAATAEESKQEEDSSESRPKYNTELEEVLEAANILTNINRNTRNKIYYEKKP